MPLAGMWEFPGGKVEPNERPVDALRREIEEELGLVIEVGRWIGRGESVVEGRDIVLDVYLAEIDSGVVEPVGHSETRWIGASEIAGLVWPEADRPILPMLRRALDEARDERIVPQDAPIVSVDWSARAAGRAVHVSLPDRGGRCIRRVVPPGDGWDLEAIVSLAARLKDEFDRSTLVAVDAVLGFPTAFGARTPCDGFLETLPWLEEEGGLTTRVIEAADWSPRRPLFAVPAGAGGLTGFLDRAGGRSVIYRQVERALRANPVFATSGIPGSVGSGSMVLWEQILRIRRHSGPDFEIWPFETTRRRGVHPTLIVGECYPKACYGVALADSIPGPLIALGKTRASARTKALAQLSASPWIREQRIRIEDLDSALGSEDDFDALMQAAGLTRLLGDGVDLASCLVDPVWEGGILGTGGLRVPAPRPPL